MAGEIKLFDDSIAVITLHKQMPNLNNGCVYHNEFYGGDTAVMHPFNIELYKDDNLRDALKGRFYELSPAPFSNTIFGTFNLTYTPNQQ